MKAVGYAESLPITDERSLFDFEAPKPIPGSRDVLVKIEAIAVNPIDTKVRKRKAGTTDSPVILGWDAAGLAEAVGANVTVSPRGRRLLLGTVRPRQQCEYGWSTSGSPGKAQDPFSPEAAALPLTALTAWECLFDR